MSYIPPGYAEAVFKCGVFFDNEPFNTMIGLELTDAAAFSQTQADALSAIWALFLLNGTYGGTASAFAPSNGFYIGARVTINDDTELRQYDSVQGAGTGAGTTTLLPQNNSYLIHKRSASLGRSNQGRMYLPYVREPNVSDIGQLDGATITFLNTRCTQLRTDFIANAAVENMVILHSTAAFGEPEVITALQADTVIATQRRRLRR